MAATRKTKAAAAVRVKLLSHGFSIDHPASELGEQLMADALGGAVADSAGVSRENLYRALNGNTRPEFETIRKVLGVLGALGVQLVAKPRVA